MKYKFYMASRNAFLPSLDNPVFQFYTPQYYFILPYLHIFDHERVSYCISLH